ncbi:MAG: bactofilin family protein [Pontibacterium sp.]
MKIVGRMHIDGAFEGTIQSLENISVGKKGHVSGQIHARHINVSGLLEGEIFCDELHIEAGGLVKATVTSKQMSISPKGNFVGQRKMLDETSPVELPAPEEASNKDAEKGKKTAQEKAVN